MIEVVAVSKNFGNLAVLNRLSMKIDNGEIVALMGPNGAGKTTLLRIISTLSRPSSGDVLMNGTSILEDPEISRRLIGVVGHSNYIYDDLTPLENLKFYWSMSLKSKSGFEERARILLERVGLTHRQNDRSAVLSKGMRQRLAIARALIASPKILLMDEPFSSLDLKSSEMLVSLILEEKKNGSSLLLVTHDSSILEKLADRADVLLDGHIRQSFSADQLKEREFSQSYKRLVDGGVI